MINNQYNIWIEAEQWEGGWDVNNNNTDVIVTFEDGSKWGASFFTYTNINTLVEKNKATGEGLGGKYFWSSDMILVDEVSRKRIEEVITHLISEDEFKCVFNECHD